MQPVESIGIDELAAMSEKMSEPLVKAVVDVAHRALVVDAGLHADEELFLLEGGSRQQDLWGINLWPESFGTDDFVEFDSMINIRPAQGNRSRGVGDPEVRKAIWGIVTEKVHG
ncbi:MAG: DUF5674 family protein [Coriobacteriales bacterium]|jgi:hypothetical protein|nr:DUF5674 family protein [Coriobacteriales bacterium]